MNVTKRIYIADDEPNIREAIQTFLASDGFHVSAFETGDALLEQYKSDPCDLVILDVMMPGANGFKICKAIREISTVPIIMLTARDSDLDYATGLSLGSDDYFTKPFSAMALVMRVKAIFRRVELDQKEFQNQRNDKMELSFGDLVVDARHKTVFSGAAAIDLTTREFDLLYYLMENTNKAVSRDELLDKLREFGDDVEKKTADDAVRGLRKKLSVSNVSIDTVWGFGFRLKVSDHHA